MKIKEGYIIWKFQIFQLKSSMSVAKQSICSSIYT